MLVRRLLALLALACARAAAQFVGPALPRDPHILTYPQLDMQVRPAPPVTLLFSDSPETPARSGVLYRDTVNGAARVLAYHANGTAGVARVQVIARNPGGAPVTLTVTRRGGGVTGGPDPLVGQQSLLRYFASRPQPERAVAPGARAVLFDSGPVQPGAVVSAMLDFTAGAPTEVSVVLLGADVAPGRAPEALPVLPPDGTHQRGTFPGANRSLLVNVTQRPARLVLGGQDDPVLTGTDALTGAAQRLAGNYGVLYDLRLTGSAGSVLAASPRGGAYRGLLGVRDGPREQQVLIGSGAGLTDPAAVAFLWRARGDLHLQFTPASGSNLPLALILYPPGAHRK